MVRASRRPWFHSLIINNLQHLPINYRKRSIFLSFISKSKAITSFQITNTCTKYSTHTIKLQGYLLFSLIYVLPCNFSTRTRGKKVLESMCVLNNMHKNWRKSELCVCLCASVALFCSLIFMHKKPFSTRATQKNQTNVCAVCILRT